MENRELATTNATPKKWDARQIETIKKTVAVGASNEELDMFLSIAGTYDLNPFLKEIWCIKMGGKAIITTSRDGYLKIANRNPSYDGMVSDVVHAGDKFVRQGTEINHAYSGSDRGPIIGAYALVYRKDRRVPTYFFAPFDEYCKKDNGTWRQYPSAMIIKVAESMALKRTFSISGLVTQEEMGTEIVVESSPVQPVQTAQVMQQERPAQPQPSAEDRERKIQLNQLYNRYLAVCNGQKNHVFNAMKKITGKENSADFTADNIKDLFDDVIRREDEAMNAELGFTDVEFTPAGESENEQTIGVA